MRYYYWIIAAVLFIFTYAPLQIPSTHIANSQLSSCTIFDSTTQLVTISCGSFRMTDLAASLSNTRAIKLESTGIWLLNADVVVSQGSTLVIDSKDVKWLKINTPYGIQVLGNLVIDSTRVTGWDTSSGNYALTDGQKPRAYLNVPRNAKGQMNITNSEIAYMGYAGYQHHGITYTGGSGSILKNNDIHDVWIGFYSLDARNLIIENNIVHDYARYGIDPHSGTSDVKIRFNTVYNSKDHIGIICSSFCNKIIIENNTLYNVAQEAIMLSEYTSNSTIRNNKVYDSGIGISIYNNTRGINVYDNIISNTQQGINLELNSSDNVITNNIITNSGTFGICQDASSKNNTISTNTIIDSVTPICAKKSSKQLNLSNAITTVQTPKWKIPYWVKNTARWWSSNQIHDSDFTSGIGYLIQTKIIQLPPVTDLPTLTPTIPQWIKTNVGWWADGQLSDDEFVKGLQFLITNGIIKI